VATFSFASCALFVWDYIITFGMEVDLVWRSKWGFVKGLYLIQRYLPFIDTVWLTFHILTKTGVTKTVCQRVYIPISVLITIGFTTSEVILTLRTWAVWERNSRFSIILPILFVLLWFPSYIINGIFVHSMKFGDPPFPEFPGCFMVSSANIKYLTLVWVLLATWDTLMLALILVPTIREYRSGGTLMKVVYRDGAMYYIYLCILSTSNAIVAQTFPIQYQELLTPMARVLHSMLASRVLLHIRAQCDLNSTNSLSISTQLT